jgi:hypothetical protein
VTVLKILTQDNWRERDPVNENFAMPDGAGMRPMTGDDWAQLGALPANSRRSPTPLCMDSGGPELAR